MSDQVNSQAMWIISLVISALSTVVWAMTVYIFLSLKNELKGFSTTLEKFKTILDNTLLEHKVLQTRYESTTKDVDGVKERIKSLEKEIVFARERNHDFANALTVLWGTAIQQGWAIHSPKPDIRNNT